MKNITYVLDIIALVIQIIATAILFFNGPKNKPDGAFIFNKVDLETPRKREKNLRIGFAILCVGFFLQLVSLLFK